MVVKTEMFLEKPIKCKLDKHELNKKDCFVKTVNIKSKFGVRIIKMLPFSFEYDFFS